MLAKRGRGRGGGVTADVGSGGADGDVLQEEPWRVCGWMLAAASSALGGEEESGKERSGRRQSGTENWREDKANNANRIEYKSLLIILLLDVMYHNTSHDCQKHSHSWLRMCV